jgi:hypothetical protein
MRWLVLIVTVVVGCVEPSVILCGDGRTCGAGTTCDVEHHLCVTQEAKDACAAAAEGGDCTFEGRAGVCSGGVCIEALCGDGVKIGLEQCDETDLGGVTSCTELGFYDEGPVGCTTGCRFDVSACTRFCGDGIKDPEERCDTTASTDMDDCTEVGYYRSGPVACSTSCEPDVSGCQDKGYCGDGTLDPQEECDDTIPTQTCFDGGYDAGRTSCTKFCSPSYAQCKYIGWKRALPGQQDSYADILVTDASTYFLATGNGFRKVVDKTPSFVTGLNSQAINALWGVANDMWLVGQGGFIGRYDGTAVTEKIASSGTDDDTLYSIWGTSNTNLYAAGNFAVLHNTGGATWPAEVTDASTYYTSVWGTATGADVYAVGYTLGGAGHTISHRTTTTTWASESLPPDTGPTRSLYGVSGVGTTALVVGAPGIVARSSGDGTWTQETYDVPAAATLTKVWPRGAKDIFVIGAFGEIGYYDGTWWRLATGISNDLTGIHGLGGDVYAIGQDNVYKHANASWSLLIPHTGNSTVAVWTTSGDKTYLLTRDVLQVKEGGQFVAMPSSPTFGNQGPTSMWQGGTAIAITSNDNATGATPITSYVSRFDGASWTTDSFPAAVAGTQLTSIAGTSTLLFAGSADGMIRSYNGSWTAEAPSAAGHRVNAIWSDASGIAFAVGYAPGGASGPAGEVRRRDATGTWTAMTLPVGSHALSAVWGSSATDVFAVGGPGPNNIYHYDGTSWTRMTSPSPYDLKAISGTSANDVFAVGANSTVIHYDGTYWTEVRVPAANAGSLDTVSARAGLVLMSGGTSVFALVRTGAW